MSKFYCSILLLLLLAGCVHKKSCPGVNSANVDWLHYQLNRHIIFKSQQGYYREYIVDKLAIDESHTEKWNSLNGKEPLCSGTAVMEAHGVAVANGIKEVKNMLRIDLREYSEDEITGSNQYEYGLSFGNGTSRSYFVYAPAISFLDSTMVMHDSLLLNNKWYQQVIEVTKDTIATPWLETWKWYFSRKEGFIGFKDRSCKCDFFIQ